VFALPIHRIHNDKRVIFMQIEFMLNTSPELEEAIQKDAIVLVPIGQVEEHGPHLPVGTDT
jgi:hypothetical protein